MVTRTSQVCKSSKNNACLKIVYSTLNILFCFFKALESIARSEKKRLQTQLDLTVRFAFLQNDVKMSYRVIVSLPPLWAIGNLIDLMHNDVFCGHHV